MCAAPMFLTVSFAGAPDLNAQPQLSLRAAIHVHSTMSTGTSSLESLARRAEQQQLDVLILSENFTLRYDYGLHPFDGFLAYRVTFPSVIDFGIQRFLDEVRAVQQRHPGLIIIPGVEVAPHYYWTGSLLHGDLTMHNAQRNLLVIGLQLADDYKSLPARGNSASFVWNWHSLANGLPLLLLIPVVALVKTQWRKNRTGSMPGSRFRSVLAATLVIICSGLLINAWPIRMPAYGSHQGGHGFKPYQALIDNAIERGALVFWSMTEARDFSQHSFGPLGKVTIKTEPHPEALILTQHYTGFGGLYQEARQVIVPGGLWDQVLALSLPPHQKRPPILIGEVAFHGTTDAGKDLDRVYTVIHSSERTAQGVLAALKDGRTYAVARGDQGVLLHLENFQVSSQGNVAGVGDTLNRTRSGDLLIRVGVSTVDDKPHQARLRVIRSGEIIKEVEGKTPLRIELVDSETKQGAWQQYRLEVMGASGELLTNPIYVAPLPRSSQNTIQRPLHTIEKAIRT
ncbi:MAG: hypothetical protein CV090_07640 [Nitrospira sp. WS238]|nr:hypothetical protein [Nitrospira sp. WS238]